MATNLQYVGSVGIPTSQGRHLVMPLLCDVDDQPLQVVWRTEQPSLSCATCPRRRTIEKGQDGLVFVAHPGTEDSGMDGLSCREPLFLAVSDHMFKIDSRN